MRRAVRRAATACAALALVATGCSAQDAPARDAAEQQPSESAGPAGGHGAHGGHGGHGQTAAKRPSTPLRPGERMADLAMPAAYTPSAPYGSGTDDYRCFLLDPALDEDAFITGLDIAPGNEKVVHHVILFRVPPGSVDRAEAADAEDDGEGWTCFGGSGVESEGERDMGALDDAPWLGAWAPGGSEQVLADDVGVPLEQGSRVVMQVHYNLLAGPGPDVTTARLRLAPATKRLAALETMLLPAPVELPCRSGRDGELCDRDAAVADAEERFGPVGQAANYLHLLCGPVRPGAVQTCERPVRSAATVRAAAGHMHLLGRAISVDVNPGRRDERRVLDIRRWNFDDQAARPVDPVRLEPGDTVRVTCRHDQSLRDRLPAFEGQDEKYVVWGEGTTDEMCLGMLLVTRD